jgi:hypothetical protein
MSSVIKTIDGNYPSVRKKAGRATLRGRLFY